MNKIFVVFTENHGLALWLYIEQQLSSLEFDDGFLMPISEKFLEADTWGAKWQARWVFNA